MKKMPMTMKSMKMDKSKVKMMKGSKIAAMVSSPRSMVAKNSGGKKTMIVTKKK
jgi:hypothetical protein